MASLLYWNDIARKVRFALWFAVTDERKLRLTRSQRTKPAFELDGHDIAILAILQRDNHTSQRAIGARVHLSAPAVQRRVRRLEDAGVVRANVSLLNPEKLGQRLTILANVDLESERVDLIDEAKAAFMAEPAVQQCYYVAGETDFVLVLSVRSMADYEQLTRRLFFGNANVKRFRTFVAMDCVKVGLEIPIG